MESEAQPLDVVDDAEEAFYDEHREELLKLLAGGVTGVSWGETYARLEPRSDAGVGILNQGATCYMNSLLQVLFHTPEFRLAIYSFKYDAAQHGDESRCIPLQLQRLFAEMQLLSASAVSTTRLTSACGMSNHVGEQHDVQELCRVLFDALGMSSKPLKCEIERLYGGRAKQYIRSCEKFEGSVYESARPEMILDLQVPIVGCKTLEEALHRLVEPEELNGDNQWFCEDLGKKVDALKGLEFESIPVILHLQLLRFVFDLATMKRKKLTDKLSIPLELDLQDLLGSSRCARYELTGMCIQLGQAGGGHYVAKVRDACTGLWLDANDKSVKSLTSEQVQGLFQPRASSSSSSDEAETQGSKTILALDSTDAYYLVYRKVTLEKTSVDDAVVPASHSKDILAENERLKVLQRAYTVHRQLRTVRVYAPSAAALARRRYVEGRMDGLIKKDQKANTEEIQSVTVKVAASRSAAYVLEKILSEFVAKGKDGLAWEWTAVLKDFSCNDARLCKYEVSFGNVREPLDPSATIGDCFGGSSSSESVAILDVCLPDSTFQTWQSDMIEAIVCRWDRSSGGASLDGNDLRVVRVSAEEQVAIEDDAQAEASPPAVEPEKEPEMSYDPYSDEMPDLFGDSQPAFPQKAEVGKSVLVGTFRKAVTASLDLQDPATTVAIVPMTGGASGKVLAKDDWTLAKYGVIAGDIICIEELPSESESQSAALYELVRNSVHLSFNHPDRPEYTEECKTTISKDATAEELKAKVASQLGLKAKALHLCREKGKPQFKDESKTVGQIGFSGNDSVFVGHGAPVPPDHTQLQVYLYSAEQGQAQKSQFFTFAVKGSWSIKELRSSLVEPFTDWARDSGVQDLTENLTWKRLRLRDAMAGKQNAILRDEKTVRSQLLGLADGRQLAIELLSVDEELDPEEVVTFVIPWLVMAESVLPKAEVIVSKSQTLAEFRKMLAANFRIVLTSEAHKDSTGERCQGPEEPDDLELAVSHNPTQLTMNPNQCTNLAWTNPRLNSDKAEALGKPLTELKEIRDGVMIVMRSRKDAANGALSGKGVKGQGKGKGAGKGPSQAKAKGFSSVEEAAGKIAAKTKAKGKASTTTTERGIHIEVLCPEGAQQDSLLEGDADTGS